MWQKFPQMLENTDFKSTSLAFRHQSSDFGNTEL